MKTNVSPRAPQGVRSKAPVRSTSARARSTPAKPLRPVDAPAPAPTPAPASSPTAAPPTIEGAPRLSPAHRALAEGLSTALLRLAEARQGIEGLAIDASNDTLSRASALDLAEEIRTTLALLEGALCECSAELVDQKASAPGLAHALALSDLVRADADAEGGGQLTLAQRFERKTARAAVDHFHRPA